MMGRWDEKENPYERLLRELMPKRVNEKKEVKAMESRELMNSMKKGQLAKVAKFPNDIWRIEAFDYSHGRVGVRAVCTDTAVLRWFAPEELNTDIRQGRRLDGYQAYCMADIAATKHLINEVFGVASAYTPKKVIYDEAAGVTVVLWTDGTKTIIRAAEGEEHDAYLGYCVALAKKMHGTNSALKRNLEKVLVVKEDKNMRALIERVTTDEENK